MIDPMVPFWQLPRGNANVLPGFYTEYYSQEDRLKELAILIARMQNWEIMLLEKVNELTEKVNELEGKL